MPNPKTRTQRTAPVSRPRPKPVPDSGPGPNAAAAPSTAPAEDPTEMTHAEFGAFARARFGQNALDWAFVCPNCGDIATARDFPDDQRDHVGQECVGRHRGALKADGGMAERGCNWAAYGLIPGPLKVTLADGTVVRSFRFAPAPQTAPEQDDAAPAAAAA